jgi:hypothetical protein
MAEADALRPGGDGPARYLLGYLRRLQEEGTPTDEWDGVVNVATK